MSEEVSQSTDENAADGHSAGGKKSKKKLIILVMLPLLLGGVGAGVYFSGILGKKDAESEHADKDGKADKKDEHADKSDKKEEKKKEAKAEGGGHGKEGAAASPFYEMPDMLVNLSSQNKKGNFLKIKVSLEMESPADKPAIDSVMPRIIDNFQVYLRELRMEDLQGSAGMYRLREELLSRVNIATEPADVTVKDVLFKEMLVQ